MNFLNSFLLTIINGINAIVPSYGLSILLFTLLIKLCVTPLDLKSRRSMQRMSALNPKLDAIKKKYGNDQEKYNQKVQELYTKEKINPMSGCLPMLISMPILFAMFAAMRSVANEQLVRQFLTFQANPGMDIYSMTEPFLWIKNLWMPDTPFHTLLPDYNSLNIIGFEVWNKVSAQLAGEGVIAKALHLADAAAQKAYLADVVQPFLASPEYAIYLQAVPGLSNINLIFFNLTIYQHFNGMFILPVLAVVTQILSQKVSMAQQASSLQGQGGNQNMMMYMFSLMSFWFCTTSSAAFALYWVFSNVYMIVQQFAFAKYFAWQDRKAATAKEVGIL